MLHKYVEERGGREKGERREGDGREEGGRREGRGREHEARNPKFSGEEGGGMPLDLAGVLSTL